MENSLLIHYFLVNLRFFSWDFCVLKMYHVRLYIVEKMGFGMARRRCGIHSKPQRLLLKTCLLHAFKTLVAYVGVCFCTHALAHIRGPRASLVIYFQK